MCFKTQARSRLVAAVACVLVAVDLWVPLYDPRVADEDNALYAEVAASPPGRLLELPALRRTRTRAASAIEAPRERPLGYATSAPPAFRAARELPERARDLGVSVVVEYRDGVPRIVTKR